MRGRSTASDSASASSQIASREPAPRRELVGRDVGAALAEEEERAVVEDERAREELGRRGEAFREMRPRAAARTLSLRGQSSPRPDASRDALAAG